MQPLFLTFSFSFKQLKQGDMLESHERDSREEECMCKDDRRRMCVSYVSLRGMSLYIFLSKPPFN